MFLYGRIFFLLFILQFKIHIEGATSLKEERKYHEAKVLSDNEVLSIANLSNMTHFVNVLDTILIPRVVGTRNHQFVKENDLSLKFIFFDGEEAFQHWSDTDSIYGARHLAEKWEKTPHPTQGSSGTNYLESIDVLVLLDLLGAPDPAFYSYFSNTERWYKAMADSEIKLAQMGLMKKYSVGKPEQQYFKMYKSHAHIEDDHLPFLRRGVPVVHLITSPFPDVWHTEGDNRNAVDFYTVENLNKILRVFTASYLKLQV